MSTANFSLTSLSRRRATTAVMLGGLAVAAWVATADRMSGMDMGGHFTAGSFGFFVALWVVMMAAMMFPSVWPAVAMFGLVVRRRGLAERSAHGRSTCFVLGYLASWTVFGLVAFALLALARSSGLDELSSTELARYVVAPVALAAALYQVVPFKQGCLKNCRGPLSFFLAYWRDGRRGAFAMGSRHGAYCVGCCWMLMALLFVGGVMNVLWIAAITIFVLAEKVVPAGRVISRAAGAVIIVCGVWLTADALR